MQYTTIATYAWRQADNFGDGPLHDLLLPKLFPRIAQKRTADPPSRILLVNGSILGHRRHLSKEWQQIPWLIFGSGFQYGILDLPANSVVYALRGELTKRHLEMTGVPFYAQEPIAYSDPAILMPVYYPREDLLKSKEILTIMKWDWKGTRTSEISTAYTEGDALGWMRKIWQSERIVTDSLHAAIIADAYDIPWYPLRWEFKWQDHFLNFGLREKPLDFVLTDRALLAKHQQDLAAARERLLKDIG